MYERSEYLVWDLSILPMHFWNTYAVCFTIVESGLWFVSWRYATLGDTLYNWPGEEAWWLPLLILSCNVASEAISVVLIFWSHACSLFMYDLNFRLVRLIASLLSCACVEIRIGVIDIFWQYWWTFPYCVPGRKNTLGCTAAILLDSA